MKSLFYVTLLLALTLLCCEDLPKPTYSGKQTFGCYVDGKRWTPKGRNSYNSQLAPVYTSLYQYAGEEEQLVISAYYGKQSIVLRVNEPRLTTGTFRLDTLYSIYRDNYAAFSIENVDTDVVEQGFTTDSVHTGEIILTRLDRSAKIVSGKFSFTGYDLRTGKTVKVKEGRFDLNF